jgi:hypothetical protein
MLGGSIAMSNAVARTAFRTSFVKIDDLDNLLMFDSVGVVMKYLALKVIVTSIDSFLACFPVKDTMRLGDHRASWITDSRKFHRTGWGAGNKATGGRSHLWCCAVIRL